jgi:hypothetical protein
MMARGVRGLLLVAGLMLAVYGTPSEAGASKARFSCQERVLIDYDEVPRGMPNNRLPREGGLPAGPADLSLKAGRSVTVEGEPISFTLDLDRSSSSSGDGSVERPANLDWTFALTLDPVNRLGNPSGAPKQRRWRLRQLRYPERSFDIHADPGLYRASVTIRKIGGRILASYRQFIKVLPLRDMLSIGVRDGGEYHAGDTVVARVENRGTREVRLLEGSALVTERLEGGTWVKAEKDEDLPSVLYRGPEFLPAGKASGCSYFTVPSDPVTAAYRFSLVAETGSGKARRVVRAFAVGM